MKKKIKPIFLLGFFLVFVLTLISGKAMKDQAERLAQEKAAISTTTASSSTSITSSSYTNSEDVYTKPIIDLSGWQLPESIDYDMLANYISAAVIRVYAGSNTTSNANNAADKSGVDKSYKTHIQELQKRGIPVAVYAYALGTSVKEMKEEAKQLYSLSSKYKPTFYWIDVEEKTMDNMDEGVEAFRAQLKSLGAENVGIYIGTYFMEDHSISTDKFDAVWIPAYGTDSGYYEALPTTSIDYDLHQYTSQGWASGIDEVVDLNQISPLKDAKSTFEKLFGSLSTSTTNSSSQ